MKLHRSSRRPIARIVSAVLAGAGALASGVVAAQTSGALEEILVTATRRGETNLQEAPGRRHRRSNRRRSTCFAGPHIEGITSSVPNFSVTRITAFNAASFAIRGVGQTDIIVYLDSPVAVNIDDFVMPSVQTQLLDTFDIERVECCAAAGHALRQEHDRRSGQRDDQETVARGKQCRAACDGRQLRPLPAAGRARPADRRHPSACASSATTTSRTATTRTARRMARHSPLFPHLFPVPS
jgi:hypothetical protein